MRREQFFALQTLVAHALLVAVLREGIERGAVGLDFVGPQIVTEQVSLAALL